VVHQPFNPYSNSVAAAKKRFPPPGVACHVLHRQFEVSWFLHLGGVGYEKRPFGPAQRHQDEEQDTIGENFGHDSNRNRVAYWFREYIPVGYGTTPFQQISCN